MVDSIFFINNSKLCFNVTYNNDSYSMFRHENEFKTSGLTFEIKNGEDRDYNGGGIQ